MRGLRSIGGEFFRLNPSIIFVTALFAVMPIMIFIPNYPSIVGMSYFFFQIQISFEFFKSSKDMEFRLLLPIRRRDIVRSRFELVAFFQMAILAFAIPCALLASLLVYPNGQFALDANFAFFGLAFIYYGIFNFVFLTMYFKSGYKWAFPLIVALIIYAVVATACEIAIGLVPALNNAFDSLAVDTLPFRLVLLVIGIAFYISANVFGFRLAAKRFDKVDV